jgi:transcriptional regulator with XRE-family HTH domain
MKSRTARNPQIGERLQLIRRRRELTQVQLAALAGLTSTVLSRLENGEQTVSAERLTDIARVLGVSLDYLCGLPGEHDNV